MDSHPVMRYYAGIGSRKTPSYVMTKMSAIARCLQDFNFMLRSGAAAGADTAFTSAVLNKQIFVPWAGFNGFPMAYPIPKQAFAIAEECHASWNYLSKPVRNLMARNAMQVLGPGLDNYSSFVVCWTPDGCTTHAARSKVTGGTGQAISVADKFNIPVINLERDDHWIAMCNVLSNPLLFFNNTDPYLTNFLQLFKE